MKNESERTCVACRLTKNKRDLMRIVRTPNGEICIDETGRMNGRGAYVCKNKDCISKCKKSNILSRQLKTQVPNEVYEQLEKWMEIK